MDEQRWLAGRFEEDRARLRTVAARMLGSESAAEDAVQESWLRLSRTGAAGIDNLSGWLTTVVARVCLDMLRARRSRREEPVDGQSSEPIETAVDGDPERDAVVADSVGQALLVVLETLPPAERVAFVLHDMFDVPFDEIAPIVERSPAAARQLASRGRRRVQGATVPETDVPRQRRVVDAFLAASRNGDFDALLELLAPDVVVRADRAAVDTGAEPEVRGAAAVAGTFAGRARGARLALVDGAVGLVWARGGRPRVVFRFTIVGGRIAEIALVADPDELGRLELSMPDD